MAKDEEHAATLFARPDAATYRCPYPTYAHLREDHPVQWSEPMNAYVVSRYDDIADVLKRPEDFSSARQSGPGAATNLARRIASDEGYDEQVRAWASRRCAIAENAPVLVNADPPQHPRQRRLLNRTFSPKQVTLLEPAIQSLTDALVDRFASRGTADLVTELAMPLPMTVIARALGIEDQELATLKRWSDAFVMANGNPGLTPEQIHDLFEAMNEFYDFMTARVEERRQEPREDLVSQVAHAKLGDEDLTFHEQLQVLANLLVGGNETTTSLIASCALMLLRQPELRTRLVEDPSLISDFVEEVLRLEPPVQGLFRIATRDVVVGGAEIPSGSFLWLLYASGNRDNSAFAKADELAWDRADSRPHLSFGGGPHFCMGSNLARAEARIAVTTLLRRLPDLALAPGENADRYYPNLIQHALTHLDVVFTPADEAA